jgi:hypothetical protein
MNLQEVDVLITAEENKSQSTGAGPANIRRIPGQKSFDRGDPKRSLRIYG